MDVTVTTENPTQTQTELTAALEQAIRDGRLQTNFASGSGIIVLFGQGTSPPAPTPVGGGGLGAAEVLIIASSGVLVVAIGLLVYSRRTRERKREVSSFPSDSGPSGEPADDSRDRGHIDTIPAAGQTLGASQADYGKKKSKKSFKAKEHLDEGAEGDAGQRDTNESADSSSNAGSSGWSSGVSSLNTGSADSLDLTGGQPRAPGSSLAELGAASAIAAETKTDGYVSIRSDLFLAFSASYLFLQRWCARGSRRIKG